MMWVLFCLAAIETAVVHILVMFWSETLAWILSVATGSLFLWLLLLIRSLRHRPVLLTRTGLQWRSGWLHDIPVPLNAVAGLQQDWTLADVKARGVVNGALIAHPNTVLRLDPPIVYRGRKREFLAHRFDDPKAFALALDALRGVP